MNFKKEDIEKIKEQYYSLLTKDDLISLLNSILKLRTDGESKKTFTQSQINFYLARLAGKEDSQKRKHELKSQVEVYNTFEIKKKSGGSRIINAPNADLILILECIDFLIKLIYKPHHSAYGFINGKSINDNAKIHVGKNYVYNIDLKDFFHSFDLNRVKMGFYNYPFNLKKEKEPIAYFLACLTTFTIDGKRVLPQGSPASPSITNLLCWRLDHRLFGLSKRFGIDYSRYADDITFSSNHNVYKGEFIKELKRIIKVEELVINPKKTRLQSRLTRQEVTGLTVNSKTNVTRKYIKEIRMYIYYCEQYGLVRANNIFLKDFRLLKGVDELFKPPALDMYLRGKLNFLSMVKGKDDSTYLKLEKRFNVLFASKTSKIRFFIDLWEKEGIDKARDVYYKVQERVRKSKLENVIKPIIDPYANLNLIASATLANENKVIISVKDSSGYYQQLIKELLGRDIKSDIFLDFFGWQYETEEQINEAFIKEIKDGNKKIVDLVILKNDIIRDFMVGIKEIDSDLAVSFIADFISELVYGFKLKSDQSMTFTIEDLEKKFISYKQNITK